MPRLLLFIFATSMVACGPEERDRGEITPANSNTTENNTDEGDMGTSGEDAGEQIGDDTGEPPGSDDVGPGIDTGTDPTNNELPVGEVCGYDDLMEFRGDCDLVGLTGCTEPEVCLPAADIVGPDVFFSSVCKVPDVQTLQEGEECNGTEERCAPGLICVDFIGECQRLCYPDTAVGCEPGEFCRRPSVTWQGIGFCDDTCNL